MQKSTILCVDDEVDNLDALERLFRKKYHVLRASSGQEALKILNQHPGEVAAIITDQRMPEMTGVEFLEKSLDSRPETVRMLLTGYTDLDSVISAVNKGQIYRYLTKPWDPVDLNNTLDRAVERYLIGQELKHKNDQLSAAYSELKTLDQAKSNFMILINHELKTPLTGVLNFAALLNETNLDEEQKLFVNRIQRSADRLQMLIDDVLIVVKSEMGQLKAETKPLQIEPGLFYLNEQQKSELNKKNQTLQENGPRPPVLGDASQIRQIIQRILHNAIKFGSESSIIEINTEIQDQKLSIAILNRGSRITEHVIDRIFKPFFIDENVMNHSSGTGMGLTICQVLLTLHGSGIQVKNLPDGVSVGFQLKMASEIAP